MKRPNSQMASRPPSLVPWPSLSVSGCHSLPRIWSICHFVVPGGSPAIPQAGVVGSLCNKSLPLSPRWHSCLAGTFIASLLIEEQGQPRIERAPARASGLETSKKRCICFSSYLLHFPDCPEGRYTEARRACSAGQSGASLPQHWTPAGGDPGGQAARPVSQLQAPSQKHKIASQ